MVLNARSIQMRFMLKKQSRMILCALKKHVDNSACFFEPCRILQNCGMDLDDGFHRWLMRKYWRLQMQAHDFPALFFLRPFRPVIMREQNTVVHSPLHLQFKAQMAAGASTVLREIWQREKIMPAILQQVSLPTGKLGLLNVSRPQQNWLLRANGSGVNRLFSAASPLALVAGAKRQASVWSGAGEDQSSRRSQLPEALPSLTVFGKGETIFRASPRKEDLQNANENSRTKKFRPPTELAYLRPSVPASMAPATVTSSVKQHQAPSLADLPLPKNSLATHIDLNRLTNQVYDALERKIRLEKQRRGYR